MNKNNLALLSGTEGISMNSEMVAKIHAAVMKGETVVPDTTTRIVFDANLVQIWLEKMQADGWAVVVYSHDGGWDAELWRDGECVATETDAHAHLAAAEAIALAKEIE